MRKRILVTDASETILEICRATLTGRGYEAVSCTDGKEALRELQQGGYDLAVVATETYTLPGYQLVSDLRRLQETKALPILMLIGSSELLEPDELFDAGPDSTLTKPFSPQELLHKIDSLLLRPVPAVEASPADDVDFESLLKTEKEFSSASQDENDVRQFLSAITEPEPTPTARDDQFIDHLLLEDEVEGAAPYLVVDDQSTVTEPGETDVSASQRERDIGLRELDAETTGHSTSDGDGDVDQGGAEQIYLESDSGLDTIPDFDLGEVGSGSEQLKAEFVRELARALAKEIAAKVDLTELLARLDEKLTAKDRY
jgi:CheY-like chemotaxis protein